MSYHQKGSCAMANKITYPIDKELTREQLYRHTVARGTSLKKLDDGTEIMVKEIVAFEDENGQKIISLLDSDNRHYVSNSSIFREELAKIIDIFGNTDLRLIIRKDVTKSGRTFVTCELG